MLRLAALRHAAGGQKHPPAKPLISFIAQADHATTAELAALAASFRAQDTGLAELILCGANAEMQGCTGTRITVLAGTQGSDTMAAGLTLARGAWINRGCVGAVARIAGVIGAAIPRIGSVAGVSVAGVSVAGAPAAASSSIASSSRTAPAAYAIANARCE